MAEAVFVHIGLPKTATTYLQTIMWSSRDLMRQQGVLLPGRERADHLWTSRIVRESPAVATAYRKQRDAWQRLCAEIAAWEGNAVISHEFLAAASTAQAQRMVADLAPAKVHVVITAREPIGLFAASWQESLKNRGTLQMSDYPGADPEHAQAIWNWRTLDLGLVLGRWGDVAPAEQIHILPLPGRTAPRDLIWQRFATLIGLDPDCFDATEGFTNSSMGVAEAETLRRINEHLVERGLLRRGLERGTIIRTYLADERLVPRGGDRFWPDDAQVEDCRRRGAAAVALITEKGYDVVGDLDALSAPAQLAPRRSVGSVTDTEVADIATDLVAQLSGDVREQRVQLRATRLELDHALARESARARADARPLWRRTASAVKQRLVRGSATAKGSSPEKT